MNASSRVVKLDPSQRGALRRILEEWGFLFEKELHAEFVARRHGLVVKAYPSGKILIQGKGVEPFVRECLEEKGILGGGGALRTPLIGTDESGKGDYFGPLAVAAVCVKPEGVPRLQSWGADDCKTLSDPLVQELGERIRMAFPHAVTVFPPEEYNRLYEELGNLNKLLAYGHGQAIALLVEKGFPFPVLIDQFGKKELVENALAERGLHLALEQRPGAEENIAVAAASIVAREAFLEKLREISVLEGMDLPRGVSKEVERAAREILEKGGAGRLRRVAKMHFKTTQKIMRLF